MVARAGTYQRIDIALDALEAALGELPEIADEWDELADGERASWSLDWDHLMGSYLLLLEEYRQSNALSGEQAQRYRSIRAGLHAAWSFIEELNLYRPPIAMDD